MSRRSEGKLNVKQERFVDEYMITLNATQAAIRAGWSPKGARVTGARALATASVAAEIARRQQKASAKFEVSAERVVRELALIGFANMQNYMHILTSDNPAREIAELPPECAAVISEMTVDTYLDGQGKDAREVKRVRFKLCDKRAALVDLGKHLGLFKEVPRQGDTYNILNISEEAASDIILGRIASITDRRRSQDDNSGSSESAVVGLEVLGSS